MFFLIIFFEISITKKPQAQYTCIDYWPTVQRQHVINDIIITSLRHVAPNRYTNEVMAGVWFRAFPPEPAQDIVLNATPGPKEMPPSTAKPVAYFFILCHLNLIREIVRQTNLYNVFNDTSNCIKLQKQLSYMK